MRTKGIPKKIYIGLDNGVTGSIGWSDNNNVERGILKMPTFSSFNYQKEVRKVTRIDTNKLTDILIKLKRLAPVHFIGIERPMIDPGRFQASLSAIRALEATLIVLERLNLTHHFLDSKQWQKELLPKGIKGADELKKASKQIGQRWWPELNIGKDADGIMIAEWARRNRK